MSASGISEAEGVVYECIDESAHAIDDLTIRTDVHSAISPQETGYPLSCVRWDVLLGGLECPIAMLVDSGAQISLLRSSLANQISSTLVSTPGMISVHSADGLREYPAEGILPCQMTVDDEVLSVMYYVIEDAFFSDPTIGGFIGVDMFKAIGLGDFLTAMRKRGQRIKPADVLPDQIKEDRLTAKAVKKQWAHREKKRGKDESIVQAPPVRLLRREPAVVDEDLSRDMVDPMYVDPATIVESAATPAVNESSVCECISDSIRPRLCHAVTNAVVKVAPFVSVMANAVGSSAPLIRSFNQGLMEPPGHVRDTPEVSGQHRLEVPFDDPDTNAKRNHILETYSDVLDAELQVRGGQALFPPPPIQSRIDLDKLDLHKYKNSPFPMSSEDKDRAWQYVNEEMKHNRSIVSTSPVCAPLFFVKKRGSKKKRGVFDYSRSANRFLLDIAYPAPVVKRTIEALAGCDVGSIVDLKSWFDQCQFPEDWRWVSAYCIPGMLAEKVGCAQGLNVSPAIGQRNSDLLIEPIAAVLGGRMPADQIDKEFTVYMGLKGTILAFQDDIVVASKGIEANFRIICGLMEQMRRWNVISQPDKVRLFYRRMFCLGHCIEGGLIRPDPSRVMEVISLPRPKTVKELRSFVGFVRFYQPLLDRIGELVAPFETITKTSARKLVWTDALAQQYTRVCQELDHAVVRPHNDDYDIILTADWSSHGIAAVLKDGEVEYEYFNDGTVTITIKRWWPCGYYSKCLSVAQLNYTHAEGEVCGGYTAVRHNDDHVKGRRVVLLLDNSSARDQAVKGGMSQPPGKGGFSLTPRMRAMLSILSEYDIVIGYLPAAMNVEADYLSRVDWEGVPNSQPEYLSELTECSPIDLADRVNIPSSSECSIGVVTANVVFDMPQSVVTEGLPPTRAAVHVAMQKDQPTFKVPMLPEYVHSMADCFEAYTDAVVSQLTEPDPTSKDQNRPSTDPYDDDAYEFIKSGSFRDGTGQSDRTRVVNDCKHYSLDSAGKVRYKKVYQVPPPAERGPIMKAMHQLGHESVDSMIARAKSERWHWPKMRADAQEGFDDCGMCPRASGRGTTPVEAPSGVYTAGRYPGQMIGIDFVTFPRAYNGSTKMGTVLDTYSHVVGFGDYATESGIAAARLVLEKWIQVYGPFSLLISDNGTAEDSCELWGLCDEHGIQRRFSTPRYSRGNSLVERIQKEAEEILRAMDVGDRWPDYLGRIAYALNTRSRRKGNYVPLQILLPHMRPGFQRQVLKPTDFTISLAPPEVYENPEVGDETQEEIEDVKRYIRHGVDLKVGDVVYRKNHDKESNLEHMYLGPFLVNDMRGPDMGSIVLEDMNGKVQDRRFRKLELVRATIDPAKAKMIWDRENSTGKKKAIKATKGLDMRAKASKTRQRRAAA